MSTSPRPLTPLALGLHRLLQTEGNAFSPPTDVLVDDEGVPGRHADNLEVELESDVLTVRGARPWPYGPDNGDRTSWRSIERPFGRFERSPRVPPGLDPNATAATLSDGVLTLRIPKPDELKPRRIEIAEATG